MGNTAMLEKIKITGIAIINNPSNSGETFATSDIVTTGMSGSERSIKTTRRIAITNVFIIPIPTLLLMVHSYLFQSFLFIPFFVLSFDQR